MTGDRPPSPRRRDPALTGTRPPSPTTSSCAGRTYWDADGTFEAPNPAGPLADPEGVAARGTKLFVLDMFPYPVGHGPARRAPAGVHRHRRLQPLPAHGRAQRAVHDGLRRLRPPGRAVRRADRHPPGRHHGREHHHLPPPDPPPRAEPRPAPVDRHDRSRLLPLDAVDLPADLRVVVRPGGAASRRRARPGPADRRAARRAGRRHPHARRRPRLEAAVGRRSRPTSSTATAWPTSPTRRSTGAPGWAPSSPTRRSPPTAAATAATSRCSSATCASG